MEFDSKSEMQRYMQLLQSQGMGLISQLECQKRYELAPRLTHTVYKQLKTKIKAVERLYCNAIHYTCDFFYYDCEKQQYVIEEVKSKYTKTIRDYPLRRNLVLRMIRQMNETAGSELYSFNEIIY